MEIDASDTQVAMEYAFLCYETSRQAEARRIFDRIRKTGNATAETAFHNIDDPLASGIERWKAAIESGANNFSAHYELARLAEQRDELQLAARHYELAWRLLPDRRSVLVDLGRVAKTLGIPDKAMAALLAASRGGEPRAAEMARELLPDHYPYVPEFRKALEFDPDNVELRRELAYLLLRMGRQPEAESEFRIIVERAPQDLLSATQLGFLLYGRGERQAADPLFQRVLEGSDEDLANRVRAVLRMPQVLRPRPAAQPASIDAKVMAERSIKAGYMNDAVKYLQVAHEADPGDFEVMLKMGWTYNMLHQDPLALRWFDLARRSSDPQIATQGGTAWKGLRGSLARFRTTAWMLPMYSTRWHDIFSYAQVKTELRGALPFGLRSYASLRFIGDTRRTMGAAAPEYLSESSFILGIGVTTPRWRGITAWAEAGSAIGYANGHMLPDYRGGISAARAWGQGLQAEKAGWFADTAADGVFISRFAGDFLVYDQWRAGYSFSPGSARMQAHWNANVTFDAQRQYWANFVETGPGLRLAIPQLSPSAYLSLSVVRGAYLVNQGNPRRPNFIDFRAGFWYAFVH
jgi:tetratricopeptide (TPR) repeat protein